MSPTSAEGQGRPAAVRAAGGVLWRPGAGGPEVAVVHRPKYDDWSLPKGKLEPGEPAVVGAAREVGEETGCEVVVGRSLGTTGYHVVVDGELVPKTVRWWAMEAVGGAFVPGAEVDELRWLPPADARALLSRDRDDEPLARLLAGPLRTHALVLVRHARAGRRQDWHGDDAARPLDARGAAQAEALARVLAVYRPGRLLSAPLERCTSTLGPSAAALRLPVERDEALTAACWVEDPERTLARLRDLVGTGGSVVGCSQGEVLPGALAGLAGGLVPGDAPTPKGSLWVLSCDGEGRVVDADHVPAPA